MCAIDTKHLFTVLYVYSNLSLLELGGLLASLPPEARGVMVVAQLDLSDAVNTLAGGDALAIVTSRVVGPVNATVDEPRSA